MSFLRDFVNLIYPKVCAACSLNLFKNEELICTKCLYELPRTNYHLDPDNPVAQIFWGRVPVDFATSLYFFHKGSKFRRLIHKLKYQGEKEIGAELGKVLGLALKETGRFNENTVIIPVPLHQKKLRKRGYNQSWWIASGISTVLNAPLEDKILIRSAFTDTQTKKTRLERWKNVETVFQVKHPEKIQNKKVILTDDVVTTGSTLEACATKLLEVDRVSINIATLAFSD